ncbi:uncharacterized protein N7496_006057 [Penicillium cataractarum]|uniref:Uncharacterized protein n=1 Tax=Penicillium cataractarum TaxID=2100454 RepID=A0A9W9S124_9EURO|nr:uncharacterized protein N7496_006057 [Penicillium cataractarum]KAJ5369965.1 hypothetical protein N7496_006057 [Penicillium cataractarum]
MSKADDCQSPNPSQFHFNEVAAALATAFSLLTLLFYIWNIGCLISSTPQTHNSPRPHKRERHEIAINPLSGLIAAVLGIVLIFATWPQPLEGASLLVVLLAQASVLGWQDHDPDSICKDLVEKVPDVLAVIVAAYALGDARKKYQDATGNTFMEKHDPRTEMILAYVLTAAGAVLGFFQELKITQDGISRDDQQRVCKL